MRVKKLIVPRFLRLCNSRLSRHRGCASIAAYKYFTGIDPYA